MGLIKLAIRSLKTDFLKSLFYFLSFVLTTIFIFLFFNLTLNPSTGINLGGNDAKLITTIAAFVILIAMVCICLSSWDLFAFTEYDYHVFSYSNWFCH